MIGRLRRKIYDKETTIAEIENKKEKEKHNLEYLKDRLEKIEEELPEEVLMEIAAFVRSEIKPLEERVKELEENAKNEKK